MTFEEKVQRFAETFEKQRRKRIAIEAPNIAAANYFEDHDEDADCFNCRNGLGHYRAKVVPGRKYTKVDFDGSGVYMIENATGDIYGIKGYGVIHRGHYYGNLDAVDGWN